MPTGKDYWKKVLDNAQKQLAEMRAERDILDVRLNDLNTQIVQLEQVLSSLEPMASEAPHDDAVRVEGVAHLELAHAIREVLKMSEQYRTPRGVRDSLKASGYDLDQHSNPLASIHGVLKRFAESGEVDSLETKGKTYYRWKGLQGVTSPTPDESDFSIRGGAEGLITDLAIVRRRALSETQQKTLTANERKRAEAHLPVKSFNKKD